MNFSMLRQTIAKHKRLDSPISIHCLKTQDKNAEKSAIRQRNMLAKLESNSHANATIQPVYPLRALH